MTGRTLQQIVADDLATPGDVALFRAERRRRSIAATFRPDPQMEGLLALRQRDPAGFRLVADGQLLIALGAYQAAKEAHDADDR